MSSSGEARKEQQQHLQKRNKVRTVFALCCCCSTLLLLILCRGLIRSSFGVSYPLTLDVAAIPRLNNPGSSTERGLNNLDFRTEFGTDFSSLDNSASKPELGTSVGKPLEPAADAVAAPQKKRAGRSRLPKGETYMWYSPHEGFSNQARELMNALKIAFLLNRTLVLPPVLDHFELKQGTCLGPLRDQRELRKLAWTAIASRFSSDSPRGYVSIADIIDLSSLKNTVKTIDLRVFLALWCGVDVSATCFGHVCHNLARDLRPRPWGSMSSCGAQFFATQRHKGLTLIHEVHDDCRTTMWTNGESPSEKSILEENLIQELRNDRTLPSDINASSIYIERKDVIETLGPSSPVGRCFLISFGTLFSRHYKDKTLLVDINASSPMNNFTSTLKAIESQAFSVDILDAGHYYVQEKIKEPFFCAHVRLKDGVFVHDQDKHIFTPLRQRLEQLETMSTQTTKKPLNVFVMTDLQREKWPGTYLHDLSENPDYKIHTMDGEEDLIAGVNQMIHFHEHGLLHGFLPQIRNLRQRHPGADSEDEMRRARFKHEDASDVRLFVEEVVCSCATLGFQGTLSSTISVNILNMRNTNKCPI